MKKYSGIFVGNDTAKKKHVVAIAKGGRSGEIRCLGEIDNSPSTRDLALLFRGHGPHCLSSKAAHSASR